MVRRRAEKLEAILDGRLPALIPWLPAIGVVAGVAVGVLLWRVLGHDVVLFREAAVGFGAVAGLVAGRIGRTRAGRWLADKTAWAAGDTPADDLTAEFRGTTRVIDPRADVLSRRGPM